MKKNNSFKTVSGIVLPFILGIAINIAIYFLLPDYIFFTIGFIEIGLMIFLKMRPFRIKKKEYVDTFFSGSAFMFAMICARIAGNYNVIETDIIFRIIQIVLGLAAGLFVTIKVGPYMFSHRGGKIGITMRSAFMGLVAMALVFIMLMEMAIVYDYSTAQEYQVEVYDKNTTSQFGTKYYIYASSSKLAYLTESISVSKKIYSSIEEGDNITLYYHTGSWGIKWVEAKVK